MSPDKSILVVLERTGDPAPVLRRAVVLARQTGARLDICLCEAEAAFALQHQFDTGGTDRVRQLSQQKAHAWIERVWQSLGAADVPVHIEIVFESPMFEAVRRRAQASHPELVVRGIGTAAECTFSVADADLVRACPAPLLLTRGRPWRTHPAVAAALDVSGEEPPQLIHRVLAAAADIARRCGASVELLFAQPEGSAALAQPPQARLASHAAAAGVNVAAMHVLSGEPAEVIAEFARRREYEILVLGALAHRHTQVGSLTAHLLEALDCDLLLVRPAVAPGSAQ
ncbi:MAG TPA: universal stress protein [Steroidobacteraceae bacterium]|nr:universal stress protein [Steroidobacteraceae bacterium]